MCLCGELKVGSLGGEEEGEKKREEEERGGEGRHKGQTSMCTLLASFPDHHSLQCKMWLRPRTKINRLPTRVHKNGQLE